MDMKKFLQAVDGASSAKPVEGSNDMKKFLNIMEGRGPLNRLTAAESIAVNSYTEYKPKDNSTTPTIINKYFKEVEVEYAENQNIKKEKANHLAERVSSKLNGFYGNKPASTRNLARAKTPPESIIQMAKKGARVDNNRRYKSEEANPTDSVTLDIPLLIRLMEYAKEDAQDDMALHRIAEKLIKLSQDNEVLSMDQYDAVVTDKDVAEDSDPCWKDYKQIGMKKKGGKSVPNCVPK